MYNSSTNSHTSSAQHRSLAWLLFVALLLLTAAVRFYHIDTVALRGDEAYTVVNWARPPFTASWFEMAQREPHPFPIFIVYWLWTVLTGTSEFAIRMLPLLSSLAGGAVFMSLVHRLLGQWWIAGLAGLLWALNPFLVYHAQDARNFSTAIVLSMLAVYWFIRALEHPQAECQLRPWYPYIVLQALGVYIYFFELFMLAVLGIWWLFLLVNRPGLWRIGLRVWALVGVLLLPIVVQLFFVVVITEYEGTATNTELILLLEEFVPTLWFGFNSSNALWAGLFLAASSVGLVAMRRSWARLVLLWMLLPLGFLTGVSYFSPVFRPRYVIHVVPAFIIAVLGISYSLPRRFSTDAVGRLMVLVITIAISIVSIIEVRDYFLSDPPKAFDWRGLTGYLEARTTANDIVVIGSADPALDYYLEGNIYYLPTNNETPTDDFERLLQQYDAIYVLSGNRTGATTTFLRQQAQPIPGDTYPGLFQARPWAVNSREIEVPLAVQFGEVALLRGYTVLAGGESGAIVLLYWEPLRQTETEHSILTHVVPSGGGAVTQPVLAVLDHGVANSLRSTTTWVPGQIVRDVVVLPQELPASEVQIMVGIYETTNPDMILAFDDGNSTVSEAGRYALPTGIRVQVKPD